MIIENRDREHTQEEILNYVNNFIILCPRNSYFTVSDVLKDYKNEFPPFIKIKQKLFEFGYITHNTNVTYLLTEKGIEASKAGGHFDYDKLLKKKERENIEKLELEIEALKSTIRHNRNAYRLSILAIIISLISLIPVIKSRF
jgi:hypothetical protein